MLTKDLLVLYAKNKQISRKINSTEKKNLKTCINLYAICNLHFAFI